MEKLITCHRLYRPPTGSDQVVENFRLFGLLPHSVANPLSSTIFAINLDPKLSMEDIGKRFFEISKTLKRDEIIHTVCVLNQGTIAWATSETIASFKEDRDKPITPHFYRFQDIGSAFYTFAAILMLHLHKSILSSTDIAVSYGLEQGFYYTDLVITDEWLL